MVQMKVRLQFMLGLAIVAGFSVRAQTPVPPVTDENVARGKYLAEEIAHCQDCHTPKTERGDFIRSQWMKGATIDFMSAVGALGWKSKSPDITSTSTLFTRWNVDGFVKFLETGKNPRGNKAGPPMPLYNLKHDDAEAIVAYLKSIP